MTKKIDTKAIKAQVDRAVNEGATGRAFNVAHAIEILGKQILILADAIAADKIDAPTAETVLTALKAKVDNAEAAEDAAIVQRLLDTPVKLGVSSNIDTAPDAVQETPKKTRKGKQVLNG